jgi:hypothetical protein
MNFHKKLLTLTFTHWVSRDRLFSERTQRGERPATMAGLGFPYGKILRQGCHD